MTPSAARNILDCICWRPEMRWVVRKISILKPIRFQTVRRNEVQSKIAPGSVAKWMEDPTTVQPILAGAGPDTDGTPRNTVALRDVSYIIEAYPLVFSSHQEDTPIKYVAMFNRRVEKGQCYYPPALGCREFAAEFEPAGSSDNPIPDSFEIGNMLYDIIFDPFGRENRAVFFNATVRAGVMVTDPEDVISDPDQRSALLTCSYKR